MSARDELASHLLALGDELAARGPHPLAGVRAHGREQFAAQGLPRGSEEEWRYTSLAGLAKQRFALPTPGKVVREALEAVASPVFACSLHVFVDGRYDPALSSLGSAADVHVESLAGLDSAGLAKTAGALGTLVDAKLHPFAALNAGLLEDGAVVRVPRGVRAEEPLHIVFVSTGAAQVRSPRLLVVAEADSHVRIIQDHVCLADASGLSNAVCEVVLGPNARVDCVTLQRENAGTFHFSNLAARLERDAHFESHVLTFDGQLVRNDLAVTLAGEGAETTLNGLFVGAGERVVDNHTLVDHAVPRCTSRQLYKGILGGSSRGVFRGRVLVRPDAQKTAAQQSNPNLLLSRGAEIDTKPQLEIHADDVKCSHGSAIGQLREDSLFYLRSRAIGEREARELLTRGFALEVLAALPIEALREGLDATLEESLAAAQEGAR